jgi:post-segregation antitoxin (ccd killing protein)
MATLKIELNDELYKDLKDSNINVQEKIKDYL